LVQDEQGRVRYQIFVLLFRDELQKVERLDMGIGVAWHFVWILCYLQLV